MLHSLRTLRTLRTFRPPQTAACNISTSRMVQRAQRAQRVKAVATDAYDADDEEFDTFDSYDTCVEKQAALDAAKSPKQKSRSRISISDVFDAENEVAKACILSSSAQCAVMWDIADEIWRAYRRQVEFDDEEARKKLENRTDIEWSLKSRTYDL